jgi:hypothetical protein
MAVLLVGAGATLRELTARTGEPIVPQAQGPMTGLGVDLTHYPLRMIPGTEDVLGGKLNDFSVEGYYRRTFAAGRYAAPTRRCRPPAGWEDDEAIVRAAYRYDFGGVLWPRVGVSFGFAWSGR